MEKIELKILLVAYQFPPYHNVGSLRIGKFAKFMESQGHEVTVLCADKILMPETLDVEIDPARIVRTQWFNVNFLPQLFFGGREQVISEGYQTKSSLIKRFGHIYRLLTNFPDERIGWLPFALAAGNQILSSGNYDFIYASSPTPTALMIANRLSKKWNVPWVAEYRDPWADKDHYDFPEWRRKFENKIEERVLKTVSGIVSVSNELADYYSKKFHKPSISAMNGYDSEDLEGIVREPDQSESLEIVYTGTVHMDIENLNPIFNALVKLGQERKNIRITFFTRYIYKIYFAAQEYGVENQVFHNERIPYRESLRVQRNADILLFLIPHQFGNLTTKIFEYIAALRPVLAIGDIKSTAGRFIEEIGIGLVSDDPGKISSQLHHWLEMKKNIREIPDNPLSIRAGFSREGQFEKIENFIIPLIAQGEK